MNEEGKRYIVIGVVSFFTGLLLINYLISMVYFYFPYGLNAFTDYRGYKYSYLCVLAISFFLISYFIIRPIRTIKGRRKLTIAEMVFGGILVVFTLFGIGFITYNDFMRLYLDGFLSFYLIDVGLNSVLLLPGVILFIHGWCWRSVLEWKDLIKA